MVEIIQFGRSIGRLSADAESEAATLLAGREYLACGTLLRREMGRRVDDVLRRRFSEPLPADLGAYEFLVRLPCAGFITTNYDVAIESAYAHQFRRPLNPVVPRDGHAIANVFTQSPFLVKLHGDVQHGFAFDEADYAAMESSDQLMRFLYAICSSYSVVFLGYGMSDGDIKSVLRLLTQDFAGSRRHVALMPESLSAAQRRHLEEQLAVNVVSVPSRTITSEVSETLVRWHLETAPQPEEAPFVETPADCTVLLRDHPGLVVPELLSRADAGYRWMLELPVQWGPWPEGDIRPANLAEGLLMLHTADRVLAQTPVAAPLVETLLGLGPAGRFVSPSIGSVNIQTHALAMLALSRWQSHGPPVVQTLDEAAVLLETAQSTAMPGWGRLEDSIDVCIVPSVLAFAALLEVDRFPSKTWARFREELLARETINFKLKALDGFSPASAGWLLWTLGALHASPYWSPADHQLVRLALDRLDDPRVTLQNESEAFRTTLGPPDQGWLSWQHPAAAAVALGALRWVDSYPSAWSVLGRAVYVVLQQACRGGYFRDAFSGQTEDEPSVFQTAYAVWALCACAERLGGYTILKAGVVIVQNGRVLLVRKRGTTQLILPGGSIGVGESPADAAGRECLEELGVSARSLRPWRSFEDVAAFQPGVRVRIEAFLSELTGDPRPDSEIAELIWVDPARITHDLSPIIKNHILPALQQARLTR